MMISTDERPPTDAEIHGAIRTILLALNARCDPDVQGYAWAFIEELEVALLGDVAETAREAFVRAAAKIGGTPG